MKILPVCRLHFIVLVKIHIIDIIRSSEAADIWRIFTGWWRSRLSFGMYVGYILYITISFSHHTNILNRLLWLNHLLIHFSCYHLFTFTFHQVCWLIAQFSISTLFSFFCSFYPVYVHISEYYFISLSSQFFIYNKINIHVFKLLQLLCYFFFLPFIFYVLFYGPATTCFSSFPLPSKFFAVYNECHGMVLLLSEWMRKVNFYLWTWCRWAYW